LEKDLRQRDQFDAHADDKHSYKDINVIAHSKMTANRYTGSIHTAMNYLFGLDKTLVVALISAAASVAAVTLTHFYKLLSELADKRRVRRMHLMALRNELVLDLRISKSIEKNTRTIGYKFLDKAWNTVDTSVIYQKQIPYNDILDVYANMQLFNLLNERRSKIKEQESYPDKNQRLAMEHVEMMELNEELGKRINAILSKIKTG